jgi:hypothetical protein
MVCIPICLWMWGASIFCKVKFQTKPKMKTCILSQWWPTKRPCKWAIKIFHLVQFMFYFGLKLITLDNECPQGFHKQLNENFLRCFLALFLRKRAETNRPVTPVFEHFIFFTDGGTSIYKTIFCVLKLTNYI